MKITRGKIKKAKKVVVYGPEGIGKSTFASKFPDPLFIDTEGNGRLEQGLAGNGGMVVKFDDVSC